ncbi:MAG TPA: DUF362 domain-containing protein [Bacteroidales bacterium]|nr:DUF362 domain-containing protein [Bacteroidales bacterium]HQP02965.1 DUF362 domain-containing protein [Bacteroidales bacterium]
MILHSMLKIKLTLLIIAGFLLTVNTTFSQSASDTAIVYFTKEISPESVMKIFEYVKDNVKGKVGIKVHFGEDGNEYFVPASMVEPLCKAYNATLIETNVAYTGRRQKTETHIELAKDHGFTFAPIDILDEGGTLSLPIEGGRHFKTALIGKNFENYEIIIYFTHFKGHGRAGFGGCIKNASMGMATPEGKRDMHFNDFPKPESKNCMGCGACVSECPANAITLNPLTIDKEKCIGCGKCISTCPYGAITKPDNAEQTIRFLEGLVEYAKPVIEHTNSIFFNIIINVSPSCDCSRNPKQPFVADIGILVSTDIVAIEAAAHDLVDKAHNCDDAFLKANSVSGKHQIDYAEQLGMGTKNYKLVNIDE